jgi:hypothetical protein
MNEAVKDYSKETPAVKYCSDLVIGARYALSLYNDGHAIATITDEKNEDYFLEGAKNITSERVESLAKRLFESMEGLQPLLWGGGKYDDDEIDISVNYKGIEREYSWFPPSDKAPAKLEELEKELTKIHQAIPKKVTM